MSKLKANKLSRRTAVAAMAAFGVAAGFELGLAKQVYKEAHDLKPGEFSWHPERAKSGPVSVIVSLPDQLVHVYRNGIRIAVSTCSTGKKGHRTPTGVFTILQKDKHHHSSTYNNASMPNMNRLTWSGIALHAGRLPGYPASHGCIRLPMKFSALLFTVTHLGTPVIIASGHTQPREIVHPGMVLAQYAESEFEGAVAKLKGKYIPKDNGTSTSVIVSRADQQILIMENGEIVAKGRASIHNPETPLGEHVFVLNRPHNGRKGLAWHAVGHHHSLSNGFHEPEEQVIKRINADRASIAALQQRMHPGMMLVMTDLPLDPARRSGKDFVIVTQAET